MYEEGSDVEDFGDEEYDYQDYRSILSQLSMEWIDAEIDHKVSKEASNIMWKIANEYFHKMYQAKEEQGKTRKIPMFPHIRRKLYKDKIPKVNLEIGYQSKQSDELTILEDLESAPVNKFPPSTHRKLYEIASVDVSYGYKCSSIIIHFNIIHYIYIYTYTQITFIVMLSQSNNFLCSLQPIKAFRHTYVISYSCNLKLKAVHIKEAR